MMNPVLEPQQQSSPMYADVVFFYTIIEEEHVLHIRKVHQVLVDAGLKVTEKKRELLKNLAVFLGHVFDGCMKTTKQESDIYHEKC